MTTVNINELEEGMVLAEPIMIHGNLLLGEGQQVTAKHLQIFKTWGVVEIVVEGEHGKDEENDITLQGVELQEVKKSIDMRFSKCTIQNELMDEIKRVAIKKAVNKFLEV